MAYCCTYSQILKLPRRKQHLDVEREFTVLRYRRRYLEMEVQLFCASAPRIRHRITRFAEERIAGVTRIIDAVPLICT